MAKAIKILIGLAIAYWLIWVSFGPFPPPAPAPEPELKIISLNLVSTGSANPKVTQENIQQTICQAGWTATVRPSTSYTSKLEKTQLAALGYPDQDPSHYEEDHVIPLELGGHPTDPGNLTPEAYVGEYGAHEKDRVENYLHREVCAGRMTLKEAQTKIVYGWSYVYDKIK